MRVLIIDNYDSFSYNLFQYFGELAGKARGGGEILVRRNDEITVGGIRALNPDALVISPGPGDPDGAGISLAALRELHAELPILGVCLGHQALGQVFGGTVRRAPVPVHGKSSAVTHDGDPLFAGVPSPFEAARYHSLVVAAGKVPKPLKVIAQSADGLVMALRLRDYPVWGVQFHPESILTPHGKRICANFLGLAKRSAAGARNPAGRREARAC